MNSKGSSNPAWTGYLLADSRTLLPEVTTILTLVEIENYFKRFGRIKKIFMPQAKQDRTQVSNSTQGYDPQNYSVQGYVFVKFYKSSSAQKALAVNNHEILGKKIDVERAYIIEGSVNESLSKLQLKLFFKGFPSDTTRGRCFLS